MENLCVVCGMPGKYLISPASHAVLSKKGECKSCIVSRAIKREWRVHRGQMLDYAMLGTLALTGVPVPAERRAKISALLARRGLKRWRRNGDRARGRDKKWSTH